MSATRYVALGDSLADATFGEASYATWYRRHLERVAGRRVELQNFARSGWVSGQILRLVQGDAGVRAAVAAADVVTVNAGGNDLLRARVAVEQGGRAFGTLQREVDGFGRRWSALLAEIARIRGSGLGVAAIDLYQPYVGAEIAMGSFDAVAAHLRTVNDAIRAAALAHGISVAAVHEAFNGPDGRRDAARDGLLAWDGIHPSIKGAQTIARSLAVLDVTPVRPARPAAGSGNTPRS